MINQNKSIFVSNKQTIVIQKLGKMSYEKIDYKSKNYEKKIEPISKELAIKVLKSKYGNKVSNTEEDIKQVGDEYIVDVHVSVEDEDEGSLQAHVHNQSLGEQKINIYTGELVEEQKK